MQIALTVLKIIPLLAIIALGAFRRTPGEPASLQSAASSSLPALAATALMTMWAFVGLEVGALPAGATCKDAARTIPRALIIGTVTVTG